MLRMDYGPEEAAPRKVIGRASIAGAGTVYQQGISLISGLIVARVIGAADYGIFHLARNLVEVTSIMARLGLEIGLQRYFGETNSVEDRAARVAVLRRLRLIASAVALLPVVAVALGLGRVLEANVYQYSGFAEVLLCLALAIPFATDIAVLGGAYRGILKLTPSVLAECILVPTIRLLMILVLFMAGWRLWAVVAGTALGSFAGAAFLAMRARSDFSSAAPAAAHSWVQALRVIRYSSILAVAVLVTTLTTTMDMLVLGRFGPAQDLGQYSLIKTLLLLMGIFTAAFGQGLGALVADRYFRRDSAGMLRIMSLTFRWVTLGTLPIFAVFLFWGAQLALLFGPSFAVSQAVVGWLAASQFIFAIFGPAGWALSMTGKHMLELKILLAGLLVAALLCSLAIPVFGQLGAAVATCTSVAVTNAARVLFVRRSIGAFPFGSDIFVFIAAGIGCAWASKAVIAQFPLSPVWSTVSGIACFLLAYSVMGWTRLLRASEKSAIHGLAASTARTLVNRPGHP